MHKKLFELNQTDKKIFKPTFSWRIMNQGRKITGGKYHAKRKKKHYEKKGQEKVVILKENKSKKIRAMGGHKKTILLSSKEVNISVNGKSQKAEIKNVIETPQNIFLARQNRLTKGAIIETSLGKARITNRPSKEGQVNAILVK